MSRSNRSGVLPILFVLLTLLAPLGVAQASENMTPLLLAVQDAPVPFMGSDGRVHLVYELGMTNFSSGEIVVEKVEVVSGQSVLQTLDAGAVAGRLQAAGVRNSAGTLPKSTHALLFLDVVLAQGSIVPSKLSHRLSLKVSAAPPDQRELSESGGSTPSISRRLQLSAPRSRAIAMLLRIPAAMPPGIHARRCPSMAGFGLRSDMPWTGSKWTKTAESTTVHRISWRAMLSSANPCSLLPTQRLFLLSMENRNKHQAAFQLTLRLMRRTEMQSFLTWAGSVLRSMLTCNQAASRFIVGRKFILAR